MLDRTTRMVLTAAAAVLAGCVTINIYFPAAAAQKAADKIIDDVWQLQKSQGAPQKGEAPPQSQPAPQK